MKELVKRLKEYAEWAEANSYEVPLLLPDDLRKAADGLTQMKKELCFYCGLYRKADDGFCDGCRWKE